MTELLHRVIAQLEKLPEEEQDATLINTVLRRYIESNGDKH